MLPRTAKLSIFSLLFSTARTAERFLETGDEENCPWVAGCCEDDCCGNQTSWDLSIEKCVLDISSPGFDGTHRPDYTYGCVDRTCCENDCCGTGTYYNQTIECCLRNTTTGAPTSSPTPGGPTLEPSEYPTLSPTNTTQCITTPITYKDRLRAVASLGFQGFQDPLSCKVTFQPEGESVNAFFFCPHTTQGAMEHLRSGFSNLCGKPEGFLGRSVISCFASQFEQDIRKYQKEVGLTRESTFPLECDDPDSSGIRLCRLTYDISGKIFGSEIIQELNQWGSSSSESRFGVGIFSGSLGIRYNSETGSITPAFGLPKEGNLELSAAYLTKHVTLETIVGTGVDPLCGNYDLLGGSAFEKEDEITVQARLTITF